jgi:hypothetical protein
MIICVTLSHFSECCHKSPVPDFGPADFLTPVIQIQSNVKIYVSPTFLQQMIKIN